MHMDDRSLDVDREKILKKHDAPGHRKFGKFFMDKSQLKNAFI